MNALLRTRLLLAAVTRLPLALALLTAACGGGEPAPRSSPDTTIVGDTGGGDVDLDSHDDSGLPDGVEPDGGGPDISEDAGADGDGGGDAGADCSSDEACADGLWCFAGVCSAGDCERGATTCADLDTLTECVRGVWREQRCDDGDVCVEGPDGGSCEPIACTPSEIGCLDDTTAYLCDEGGASLTRLPCRGDQYCEEGVCLIQVCTPGERGCDGTVATVCDERGASLQTTRCTDDCAADGGCVCEDGTCVGLACVPSSRRCDGDVVIACDAAGAAEARIPCGGSERCVAGECVAAECEPGVVECLGETLSRCDATGESRALTDCDELDAYCEEGDGSASCVARVCTPNAQACVSVTARSVCDARGTSTTTSACPPSQYCSGGACVADVCAAGTRRCDGDTLRVCNEAGSSETATNCAATGQFCDASGTPTCRARACEPGDLSCRAGDLMTCNSSGTGYETTVECPVPCASGSTVCGSHGEGATCTRNADCHSNLCTAGVCAPQGTTHVPAATFTRGTDRIASYIDNELESPAHEVTLTRGLYFGQAEITQDVWLSYVGSNPSLFVHCGGTCPVETVSWYDAVWFANLVSAASGLQECYELSGCTGTPGGGCPPGTLSGYCDGDYVCSTVRLRSLACTGYRLPTEAEWEWAVGRDSGADYVAGGMLSGSICSADPALAPYARFCGNSTVAWEGCVNLSSSGGPICAGPSPVASRTASPDRIHDALGNVAEWVWDAYDAYPVGPLTDPVGPARPAESIRRGGSWWSWNRNARITTRWYAGAALRSNLSGVRLVRTAFASQCDNGVRDGGEADVDCGGPCALCSATATCGSGTQCLSGSCSVGRCL